MHKNQRKKKKTHFSWGQMCGNEQLLTGQGDGRVTHPQGRKTSRGGVGMPRASPGRRGSWEAPTKGSACPALREWPKHAQKRFNARVHVGSGM